MFLFLYNFRSERMFMLFKSLRIKLWMNAIKAAADIPSPLEKEILAHKPQRISQLAFRFCYWP
jgi:hypothetical protein